MAEPREVRPGTFALRAYVGRSATGSPKYLHGTYVHHRKDSGMAEARRRQRSLEQKAREEKVALSSLGALLDDWLAHAHKIGRSPTTLDGYGRRVPVIKRAVGGIQLEELTARHLDNWYADLLAEGRSPADIRAFHRIISAALNQGEKWNDGIHNVARRATVPRVPGTDITPPTPEEVATLIRIAENSRTPEMASIIFFLSLTGMRRGELCGLRWERVDWEGATVRVDQSVWQARGRVGEKDPKTHQVRTVGIGGVGVALLRTRWDRATTTAASAGVELDPVGFVWCSDEAGRRPWQPDRLTQAFGRLRATAAKQEGREWPPYRLHDLRHYSATELLVAGVDLATVSERLGHAQKSTTSNIYSHGRRPLDDRAAEILGTRLAILPPDQDISTTIAQDALKPEGWTQAPEEM